MTKHPCRVYECAGIAPMANAKEVWRNDDTCSYCGGLMPEIALGMIASGTTVVVPQEHGAPYLLGNMRKKFYPKHCSLPEAIKLTELMRGYSRRPGRATNTRAVNV